MVGVRLALADPADAATVKAARCWWLNAEEVPTTLTKYVACGVDVDVLTVIADVPEPPGTDDGEKLQVVPGGNPRQDSATAPLKPPAGFTVMVVPVEFPGFTTAGEKA